MSGPVALSSDASSHRLLVLDGEASHDVFDLLGIAGNVARARSALLFEVGEQLSVRIEQDGKVWDTTARVRAHVGQDDARVTELEIAERSQAPRGRPAHSARSAKVGP
jgi:predicted metalloprotease